MSEIVGVIPGENVTPLTDEDYLAIARLGQSGAGRRLVRYCDLQIKAGLWKIMGTDPESRTAIAQRQGQVSTWHHIRQLLTADEEQFAEVIKEIESE